MTRIKVHFVIPPEILLPIKYAMNAPKNSVSSQPKTPPPSLFQVAARVDEFIDTHPEAAIPLSQKISFVDLMISPQKVAAVLKTAEVKNKIVGKAPVTRAPSVRVGQDNINSRTFKKKSNTP